MVNLYWVFNEVCIEDWKETESVPQVGHHVMLRSAPGQTYMYTVSMVYWVLPDEVFMFLENKRSPILGS